jgi:cytochrome c oxidase cbb3-type subunit 3
MAVPLLSCSESSEANALLASRVADATAIARGRALFVQTCALCHGERADGNGVRHTSLSRRPPDFSSESWHRTMTPARIFATIRDGKPGTSMPSWRSLDAGAIADLTAFVWSVAEGR